LVSSGYLRCVTIFLRSPLRNCWHDSVEAAIRRRSAYRSSAIRAARAARPIDSRSRPIGLVLDSVS
jgi:hypothetical protein